MRQEQQGQTHNTARLTALGRRTVSPDNHDPGQRWARFVGLVAVLALPGALPAYAQDKTETPKPKSERASLTALMDLQDAFAAIADQLEPAVVTVLTTTARRPEDDTPGPFGGPTGGRRPRRMTGTGSGVIISKDGWVLTNDHVIGNADKVIVRLHDGHEYPGTVRRDYRSDLALVKITSPTPFPMVKLGDSDKIKIGHWAIAIGSPYRYEGSFSVGVISSLFRSQTITDFNAATGRGGIRFYPHMIQTDAAINPGNSGGPLCNLQGEVIGINTAIESEGGGSVGIGFAIPSNAVKYVVAQLLEKGRVSYGFLGVKPTSVTPRLASALSVEYGALISEEPTTDTPAAKAGLHAGDVVTAINKKSVTNELDLRTIISQTLPNTTVELTVMREGHEQKIKTTLTEAPTESEPVHDKQNIATGKPHLGIEVQPLTERLASDADVPAKTPGVVIKAIDPNSTAGTIEDLNEGLVILKVNNTPTPTVTAFQAAISGLKTGDQVKLLCQTGKSIRFFVVEVD